MKFLYIIYILINLTQQNYHKYDKLINKLAKSVTKMPKGLVYPPDDFLDDKKIILPKGIDPDKVHMTISIKELKQHKIPIKPAIRICRSLGLMSIVMVPLSSAVEEIIGFLPPPFQKIVKSKQFKFFLKYMLIWYLRERLVFFSTINALKDPKGRIERRHDEIREKAMETYQKYEDAVEELLVTKRNIEYYWNVDKTVIVGETNTKIENIEQTFTNYEMRISNNVMKISQMIQDHFKSDQLTEYNLNDLYFLFIYFLFYLIYRI